MKKVDKFYIDLRDYAYLSEKRKNGEWLGKVRYSGRIFVLYGIYCIFTLGVISYSIRAFYYIPYIKTYSESSYIIKAIISLLVIYLPFRILFYFLERKYISTPLPSDDISIEEYDRKKRVYWYSFIIGISLIIFLVFITVQIGSVVDGPIF